MHFKLDREKSKLGVQMRRDSAENCGEKFGSAASVEGNALDCLEWNECCGCAPQNRNRLEHSVR